MTPMKSFNYSYEYFLAHLHSTLNKEYVGRQQGWRESQCTIIKQNGSLTSAFSFTCFGNIKKNLMRGSDSFASQLLFFPADESKYKWIRNDFSCEQMGFFHEIWRKDDCYIPLKYFSLLGENIILCVNLCPVCQGITPFFKFFCWHCVQQSAEKWNCKNKLKQNVSPHVIKE